MKVLRWMATAVAVLGLFAFSGPALAEAPVWSYIEAGYTDIDVDDLDDDGDGWFGGASIGLFKSFHVFGRYTSTNLDNTDYDVGRWVVGGGWHGMLGENADLVGELAWVDADYDVQSDNGYFARAGVRWRPIRLFEAGAFARYEDVGDFDSDVLWEANALVYIWRVGVGVSAELGDVDTYNVFGRFNFGN